MALERPTAGRCKSAVDCDVENGWRDPLCLPSYPWWGAVVIAPAFREWGGCGRDRSLEAV